MAQGLRPNVARIPKAELIRMSKWRCKHGETGLSHYRCWLKEHPDAERIGFWDIETTNLKANYGIMLCYAIADANSDKVYTGCITKGQLKTCLDEKIVKDCIRDLRKFDRVIGYYSSRFDGPFLRTRALSLGVDFPEYGELLHNDLYYVVRNKLSLHSNRLEHACKALFGQTEKTKIEPNYWVKALMGDAESLAYIHDHCIHDVLELKKLYNRLHVFQKGASTSL